MWVTDNGYTYIFFFKIDPKWTFVLNCLISAIVFPKESEALTCSMRSPKGHSKRILPTEISYPVLFSRTETVLFIIKSCTKGMYRVSGRTIETTSSINKILIK